MSNDQPSAPTASTEAPTWAPGEPVVAGPGQYYRNTRYIMTVVLILMGLWFGYDGFVAWPKSNQIYSELEDLKLKAQSSNDRQRVSEFTERQRNIKYRTDTDILLQKILCFVLPPVGVILLIRALHNSRAEYRLEGTTLSIPGHPPVPFENITEIDRGLWDRKGIAYISYDLGNGQQGRLRLDDFVYDRPPTDEIFRRVEEYVSPPENNSDAAPPEEKGSEKARE